MTILDKLEEKLKTFSIVGWISANFGDLSKKAENKYKGRAY